MEEYHQEIWITINPLCKVNIFNVTPAMAGKSSFSKLQGTKGYSSLVRFKNKLLLIYPDGVKVGISDLGVNMLALRPKVQKSKPAYN